MKILSILLNKILKEGDLVQATSIYLAVGLAPVFKKNNKFLNTKKGKILLDKTIYEILESFLSEEELDIVNKKKELKVIKTFYEKHKFRINIFLEKSFPSISFHKIDNDIRNFNELNFPLELEKSINLKSGLLIVTGPHNSGKTSTIRSIIKKINEEQKKYIMTLENPIEHIFLNKKSIIKQRELIRDMKDYKSGIVNCLEEDVDVVYISENKEDFENYLPSVLDLASGNCLVILEMGAENSIRAIENILNILTRKRSLESSCHLLADVLLYITAQKLIDDKNGELLLVSEFLFNNNVVSSLIKKNEIYKIENIMHNSNDNKMITMKQSMLKMGKYKKIDMDEIRNMRNLK